MLCVYNLFVFAGYFRSRRKKCYIENINKFRCVQNGISMKKFFSLIIVQKDITELYDSFTKTITGSNQQTDSEVL